MIGVFAKHGLRFLHPLLFQWPRPRPIFFMFFALPVIIPLPMVDAKSANSAKLGRIIVRQHNLRWDYDTATIEQMREMHCSRTNTNASRMHDMHHVFAFIHIEIVCVRSALKIFQLIYKKMGRTRSHSVLIFLVAATKLPNPVWQLRNPRVAAAKPELGSCQTPS